MYNNYCLYAFPCLSLRLGSRGQISLIVKLQKSWDTIRGGFSFRIRFHPCKETTTFIINGNGIHFSSQEQIAYFLTHEAVYLLVHFKFLRVYIDMLIRIKKWRPALLGKQHYLLDWAPRSTRSAQTVSTLSHFLNGSFTMAVYTPFTPFYTTLFTLLLPWYSIEDLCSKCTDYTMTSSAVSV